MEESQITKSSNKDEFEDQIDDQLQELSKSVTRVKHYDGHYLHLYNNTFWCRSIIKNTMDSFQNHFQPKDTDIILATAMKSGTTWLKALAFAIVNRSIYSVNTTEHPLLTKNPHDLIPILEFHLHGKDNSNLEYHLSPRILSTHVPYSGLPNSILTSKCHIVHICRNPLDQFISYWHFMFDAFIKECDDKERTEMPSFDEAFNLFCRGMHSYGPFWDHALGYWRASIENPKKVLFLKYEDLKEDINSQVMKIAEFLGFGFTIEEVENQGMVEQISELCSFEHLKSLNVNKEGRAFPTVGKNNLFFRNGKVGDWANYLSPSQAQVLEDITKEKLAGSGLTFKSYSQLNL